MVQAFKEHYKNHIANKRVEKNGPFFPAQKVNVTNEGTPTKTNASDPFNIRGVIKFKNNIVIETSIKSKQKNEEEKKFNLVKTTLKSGNLEKIISLLEEKSNESIFSKEALKIKEEYEKDLSSATFLTQKDWKILVAIELCDEKTFQHSIGTYLVIRKKIEERLKQLGQKVVDEGVLLEQLYRACLFHDIGKMAIPEIILNSTTTDRNWVTGFMALNKDEQDELLVKNKIIIPDAIRDDNMEMIAFFEENNIRAVKFVPIRVALPTDQQEKLVKQNINLEDSLVTIIKIHEKKSEEILKSLGYSVESLLAGNHHNYKHKDEQLGEKPASLSSIHISVEIASNILHIGDVQHALNGDRSYHHKHPMLKIMASLVGHANDGIISPDIAALWINDELKKMDPEYLKEILNMTAKHQHHKYLQKRHEELLLIDEFLNNTLPSNESLYDDLPEEKETHHHAA